MMNAEEFSRSLSNDAPPSELTPPAEALWWDAKGEWARAHGLIDELETPEAMAVHAYLHRKEGEEWNANYCIAGPASSIDAGACRRSGRPWSKGF